MKNHIEKAIPELINFRNRGKTDNLEYRLSHAIKQITFLILYPDVVNTPLTKDDVGSITNTMSTALSADVSDMEFKKLFLACQTHQGTMGGLMRIMESVNGFLGTIKKSKADESMIPAAITDSVIAQLIYVNNEFCEKLEWD